MVNSFKKKLYKKCLSQHNSGSKKLEERYWSNNSRCCG